MTVTSSTADRILALIDGARHVATTSGRQFDLEAIYVRALVRCGLSADEARRLVADPAHDPVGRILHFAGESHNFAVLAIEEALAAA